MAARFRSNESGGVVLGGVVLGVVIPAALGHTDHGLLCRLQTGYLADTTHHEDHSRTQSRATA